jgi:predicted Zn-dependent protease
MCRLIAGALFMAIASIARADFVIVAPQQGMAFSAAEVQGRARAIWEGKIADRKKAGVLGCHKYCARLQRIFVALQKAARQHSTSDPASWHLAVTTSPTDTAFSVAGGYVLISEAFIDSLDLSDDQVAFVLAHEMSHVLYQHERQYLTDALHLLPRGVVLSVDGLYGSLQADMGLSLKLMPKAREQELQADRGGFLLATCAGFSPSAMLGFMAKLERWEQTKGLQDPEHPPASQRLQALEALMPVAHKLASPPAGSRF